jgi:hypothetical protein
VVRTPVGEAVIVLATQQRRYGATAVHLKARGSRQQYMQLHEGRVALGPVALSRLIHVGDPRSAPAAVTALLHVPPAE